MDPLRYLNLVPFAVLFAGSFFYLNGKERYRVRGEALYWLDLADRKWGKKLRGWLVLRNDRKIDRINAQQAKDRQKIAELKERIAQREEMIASAIGLLKTLLYFQIKMAKK